MTDDRIYQAEVQVTLRYRDGVYASSSAEAKERFRRSIEDIFEELSPTVLDVMIYQLEQRPEAEDFEDVLT